MTPEQSALQTSQRSLIDECRTRFSSLYKPGKHHALSALQCGSQIFFSLHLDSRGFDDCAEPGAISQAILANAQSFDTIVTVSRVGDELQVINPCGNCRQIFLNFCPDVNVIINSGGRISAVKASDLLPFPY